jgi:hypothetical protein
MSRPPRKWNLPLTYRPKIAQVASGEIRQTIRPGSKYSVGDLVAFHGWAGRPYRSPWTDRTPYFKLTECNEIRTYPSGIRRSGELDEPGLVWRHCCWTSPTVDHLAILDGIDPPTGRELGRLLIQMHDIPEEGMVFQILRW